MNTFIKYLGLIIITVIFVSCDSYPSLQKYYVDNQENAGFISADFPASIIQLKNEDSSDEIKETLKSIKKVNFIGFKLTEDNKSEYEVEKLKVAEILKNPKYQELIRGNYGTKSMTIKFLGEPDAIDEVIIFGADKGLGFAVVRILGNNMDPSKMIALSKEINIDNENGSFKQLESFMKDIN